MAQAPLPRKLLSVVIRVPAVERRLAMTYALQFGDLLPYWDVLAWGLLFTVVLTLVSTVRGGCGRNGRRRGAARSDRHGSGRVVQVYVELIAILRSSCSCSSFSSGLPAAGVKLTETEAAFLAMTVNSALIRPRSSVPALRRCRRAISKRA